MRSAALLALLVPSALAVCSHDLKPEPAHPVLVKKYLEKRQREATDASTTSTRRGHHSSSSAAAAAAAPAAAATTAAAPAAAGTATVAPAVGAINPFVEGAPPLPDCEFARDSRLLRVTDLQIDYITGQQIDIGAFPPLDVIPDINSAKVQGWIAEVNAKRQIPKIPVTGIDGCSNSTFNAQALKDAGADANCWWTCGGCER